MRVADGTVGRVNSYARPQMEKAEATLAWQIAVGREAALNETRLRARGWTKALIAQFLPEPDRTVENPYHRTGPPIRQYALSRVEAAEASPEWQEAKGRAAVRQAAMRLVAERKREETLASVDSLVVDVTRWPVEQVIREAVDSFNDREYYDDGRERPGFVPASLDSDPHFLHRISRNFLRHEMTDYHHDLWTIRGKVGTEEAYERIKDKVMDAIERAYPDLYDVCVRLHSEATGHLLRPEEPLAINTDASMVDGPVTLSVSHPVQGATS